MKIAAASTLLFLAVAIRVVAVEAVTIGVVNAWTGNAYVPRPGEPGSPYDFDVTGSEAVPVDAFGSVGLRWRFGSQPAGLFAVTFSPALQFSTRYYLLYASGRVVPSQIEAAAGAEGDVPGIGSARVATFRIPVPLGAEVRFAGGHALVLQFSPTLVLRVLAGDVTLADEGGDVSGMYRFFYDRLRFLMPEATVGYRFSLSDSVETALHAGIGVSIQDLVDTSLPWYDQTRIAVGIDFAVRPPFDGLMRGRARELPAGVEPFPEDPDAGGP